MNHKDPKVTLVDQEGNTFIILASEPGATVGGHEYWGSYYGYGSAYYVLTDGSVICDSGPCYPQGYFRKIEDGVKPMQEQPSGPKKIRPKITTLQLFFGYAEAERMAGVVLARRTKGFTTASAALKRFFLDCKGILVEQRKTTPKVCCQKASESKRPPTYCPTCGGNVQRAIQGYTPSQEDVVEFVLELDGTNDSVGGDVWESLRSRGWDLGVQKSGDMLTVLRTEALLRGDPYDNCHVSRRTVGKGTQIKKFPKAWFQSLKE